MAVDQPGCRNAEIESWRGLGYSGWMWRSGRKLVKRLEAPREITRDEPRQHWTDIYCGHLSVGEFLRDVDCPVVSEWQDAAY